VFFLILFLFVPSFIFSADTFSPENPFLFPDLAHHSFFLSQKEDSVHLIAGQGYLDYGHFQASFFKSYPRFFYGLGYRWFGTSSIEETQFSDTGKARSLSTFSHLFQSVCVNGGIQVNKTMVLGSKVTYQNQALYTASASSWSWDVGVKLQKDEGYLGMYTVNMVSTPFQWSEGSDKMSPLVVFEAGYSYSPVSLAIKTIFSETVYLANVNFNRFLKMNTELHYRDRLFRYGAGLKLDFGKMSIDYFYSASVMDLETIGVNYMGLGFLL